ncbi:alpha-L-fucosidase, partial [Planctomycetota bacterium]
MKQLSIIALSIIMTSFWLTPGYSQDAERPNIIFIMADDLGPGDVAHYTRQHLKKPPLYPTPNIDALAREGLWFTDAHSSTALCSPTRYCVMSGNLNYRSYAPWGVWGTFRQNAISPNDSSLGSVTKAAGYVTGFIGKWHLGGDFRDRATGQVYRGNDHRNPTSTVDLTSIIGGGPQSLGFDYSLTLPCGIQGPIYTVYENGQWYPLSKTSSIVYLDENSVMDPRFISDKGPGMGDSHWDARQMGKLLSSKAVDFINDNAGKEPFFLCYWSPMVHLPHCPPKDFDGVDIANTTPSAHLDTVRDLDQQLARIVKALKDNNSYDNTLILFTSDNGGLNVDADTRQAGHDSSGAWRGFKNSPHEGGTRVPFIAVWPGRIQAGRVCHEPIVGHDVLATLAALVGTDLPDNQAMDSLNLLPLLLGEPKEHRPQRNYLMLQGGSRNEVIFREDSWKLIIQSNHKLTQWDPVALFNLHDNPLETEAFNFIHHPEHQDRVQSMLKRYLEIRQSQRRTVPSQSSFQTKKASKRYESSWESVTQHPDPDWFRDAKFGIYFHWGPYSVPAHKTEWYSHWMYQPGHPINKHHVETYGPLDEFGYKDFIPMFTAEKFDPDSWVRLFKKAGARFAGPVAEHADGFAMWDSDLTDWNAVKMGPKRDIVAAMEKAIRKQGLKFITTLHHQWLYAWYPTQDPNIDASNPAYRDLYGPPAPRAAFDGARKDPAMRPGADFNERWLSRAKEVVDKYQPDLVWFDNKLSILEEKTLTDFLSHYYNQATVWDREVITTYKGTEFKEGAGILDLERARMRDMKPFPWLVDDSIDWNAWCHVNNPRYKTTNRLIDFLVDVVSKNGCLLLNITPTAAGEIPMPVQERLLAMGQWLDLNGEAIYESRPWKIYGEGS